jgi:hypothetical protein
MSFDLGIAQFDTQEMLACIPGLSHKTYRQWVERGVVLLSTGPTIGRGRRALFRGTDVIQVAFFHEMARQGMYVSKSKFMWGVVNGAMLKRQFPPVGYKPNSAAMFSLHPETGELLYRLVHEDSPDEDPAGLNRPDAPDFVLLFRTDRFIDRMIRQMEQVKAVAQ